MKLMQKLKDSEKKTILVPLGPPQSQRLAWDQNWASAVSGSN
jgi:hypothetical protein